MTKIDHRGCPFSCGKDTSLERYEAALEMFHSYFGDPLKTVNEILEDDPTFAMGHCFRLACFITGGKSPTEKLFKEAIEKARLFSKKMNQRELLHLEGAEIWAKGKPNETIDHYGKITIAFPKDTLALQVAFIGEIALGRNRAARDRVARVLPFWTESDPGFGYVLGMHAYSLQENFEFKKAEKEGHEALAIFGLNAKAILAVSLSLEKQGRLGEAVDFLLDREDDWATNNRLSSRIWGQMAHLFLELGENQKALSLLDKFNLLEAKKSATGLGTLSSLLWRLNLLGLDVSRKAKPASDYFLGMKTRKMPGPRFCHAMMAHLTAGRIDAAENLLSELTENGDSTNLSQNFVTTGVLEKLGRALIGFQKKTYKETVEIFCSVWSDIDRLGGGNQRRDLYLLTWIEAAIRANDRLLAKALISERLQNNPNSRMNIRLLSRVSSQSKMAIGA